jgi:hypothetical protein
MGQQRGPKSICICYQLQSRKMSTITVQEHAMRCSLRSNNIVPSTGVSQYSEWTRLPSVTIPAFQRALQIVTRGALLHILLVVLLRLYNNLVSQIGPPGDSDRDSLVCIDGGAP